MEENEPRVDVAISGLSARYGATGVRALLKAIAESTTAVAASLPADDDGPAARPAVTKTRVRLRRPSKKPLKPADWSPKTGRVAKDKNVEAVVQWFADNGIHASHVCAQATGMHRKTVSNVVKRAVELGLLRPAGTTRPAQGGLPVLTFEAVPQAATAVSVTPAGATLPR